MMKFKTKPLLSLLLALVMVLTMLPMTALAAEVPEETTAICTDEACEHEHTEEPLAEETPAPSEAETPETAPVEVESDVSEEIPEAPEVDALPAVEMPPESTAYSGYIGDSAVAWELDPVSGRLFITGSGNCETFTSPDDQPWADLRTEIHEVWFNSMDTLTIENLAYWFAGCTALETAEVPYTTLTIGEAAFADCPSLYRLMLYYMDVSFSIAQGAFYSDTLVPLEVDFIPQSEVATEILYTHDWSAENRAAYFEDVYSMMQLASGYCSYCKGTYSYTLAYEQWTSSVHCVRHWCYNCGTDQAGGVLGESHSFSNGVCTKCGYDNGSGGCSGGGSSTCYHTSTRTTWSGCDWYEYCRNCGELVDSGTSHGTYVYDSWEYYSSTRHRRYYYCSDCGEGSYTYGSHSTSTRYSQYSSTQHSVSSYCSTCATTISTSYTSHSFSYGSWQNYNGTQHRRLKTCSQCGYSEYEYSSHSLSYGSWTNYSASQHRRTVSCSTCGHSSYEYASHTLSSGAWSSISATQHRRTLSCSCGYSTTETASHLLCYGAWASISDTQHQRTGSCSCGYSTTESGAHSDADDNGYCDDCEYLMTRFSVTVPASLSLTVSERGEVYAATNAAIVNNSTGAVAITGVTVNTANGWTLVPYNTNFASAKVDSKQIAFSMNGAASSLTGTSEVLSLNGGWAISSGASLPLTYDAIVSATSTILNEQALTVVFVIEWQPK
ncbi:MAG: hypothetical protein PHY23_08755 [Oscillospiraceae bacterium]|nr:hypothetical protein [Oscillospiraceae bacterium]